MIVPTEREDLWVPSTRPAALPAGTVDVWRARLDLPEDLVTFLATVLSREESARAERFHFARDRCSYVVARGILRKLLGDYLEIPAEAVRIEYGGHGKPFLSGESGLRFNISHSGALALLAFAREREVGIDVERIRTVTGAEEIAARFFSAAELETLRQFRGDARREVFFRCWTRKEAFIKAGGAGLSLPLDQFDVPLGEEMLPASIRTRWEEVRPWCLVPIPVGQGYQAALVVEGTLPVIRYWDWTY